MFETSTKLGTQKTADDKLEQEATALLLDWGFGILCRRLGTSW